MAQEKVEYKKQWCKYQFSDDELKDIAEKMAIKTHEKTALENEKKAVASKFKERIESVENEIKSCASLYKDRYEMRDIECYVERDYEGGVIRYIRTDNGEIAQTDKMSLAERQMRIDELENEKKKEQASLEDDTDEQDLHTQNVNRTMAQETSAL